MMIFDVFYFLAGKISNNCYLFFIKLKQEDPLTVFDIGTLVINIKTGISHISMDKCFSHCFPETERDKLIKKCKETILNIEEIL